MLGFDVQLSWDPTVIQCISHTVTVPFESYSTPISSSPYPGVLHSPILPPLKNVVNDTGNITDAADPSVRAWFAYASNAGASVFNGNGTFCTLTFKALTKGESSIRIVNATLAGVYEIGSEASTIGQSATGQWLNGPASGTVSVSASVTNSAPSPYWFPWSIIIVLVLAFIAFIIAIFLIKSKRSKRQSK
jgi:hypothetical protein